MDNFQSLLVCALVGLLSGPVFYKLVKFHFESIKQWKEKGE
jgi:hypothetical protein